VAIGWLTVFKAIPWTEVLKAAPAVARSARKLWDVHEAPARPAEVASRAGEDTGTEARLRELEAQVARLSTEAIAASDLVNSLAEQNVRLVEAVEILRVRTRILAACCAIVGLLALASLGWLLAG